MDDLLSDIAAIDSAAFRHPKRYDSSILFVTGKTKWDRLSKVGTQTVLEVQMNVRLAAIARVTYPAEHLSSVDPLTHRHSERSPT